MTRYIKLAAFQVSKEIMEEGGFRLPPGYLVKELRFDGLFGAAVLLIEGPFDLALPDERQAEHEIIGAFWPTVPRVQVIVSLDRDGVTWQWRYDDRDLGAPIACTDRVPRDWMSIPSKIEFPFRLVHADGCGGDVVFLRSRPKSGDGLRSDGVIFPNGTAVSWQSAVTCGSCGKPARALLELVVER